MTIPVKTSDSLNILNEEFVDVPNSDFNSFVEINVDNVSI